MTIRNNAGLVDLKGLGVTGANTLSVVDNPSLKYVEGLSKLTNVGVLEIRESPELVDVEGLRNLVKAQSLSISGSYLSRVDYIWYSRGVTTLAGLRSLVSADFISISYSSMPSLAGLDQLRSVNTLQIGYNDNLRDLAGLGSLTTVGDVLEIGENDQLASLHGLENLTSVERLLIYDNPVLTSFAALQSLQHLSSLEVSGNTGLASCEARRLFVRARGTMITADGVNSVRACPAP